MIPVKLRQAVTCQIEAIGGEEEDAAAAAAAAAGTTARSFVPNDRPFFNR